MRRFGSAERGLPAAAESPLSGPATCRLGATVPDGRLAAHLELGASRPCVLIRFGHGPEVAHPLRRPVDQILIASSCRRQPKATLP
jgi:hypothetical protein